MDGVNKKEVYAREILERIHVHSKDDGGIFSLTTGSQGSAKTSSMLSFLNYNIIHHPDEPIFFSNCYDSPLQFTKLGPKKWHIFVKQGSNIIFRDRDYDLKVFEPPHKTYFKVTESDGEKDYSDLWNKAKRGKCNAVFFGDRYEWMDFIAWLRARGRWSHVFIDEMAEITPAGTSGDVWHNINEFVLVLKDVRKSFVDVFCNSQACHDIDYRVWSRIMLWVYLPGAQKWKTSPIKQHVINSLEKSKELGNEAFLEFSKSYGKVRFTDIYKPMEGYHWDAHVVKEKNA